MDYKSIGLLIVLGVMLLVSIVIIFIELFNGKMKTFIMEKVAEAEKMFPKEMEDHQAKRRNYVIEAFKEKYKIMSIFVNAKKFIELLCKLFGPKGGK